MVPQSVRYREVERTRKGTFALVAISVIIVLASIAMPVVSHGSFSGNQQYGGCNSCHATVSSMSVTFESSPSASTPIAPGSTVTVWVNVSGSVSGANAVGALISSTTASSGSLPTQNGWTIVTDPSGTSSTYNYYKNGAYVSGAQFRWVLTAPATAGAHPLYAKILHSGSTEYYRSAGPLSYNVQAAVISPPSVQIAAPTNGQVLTGTVPVTATAIPASGQSIAYVQFKLDGVQFANLTTAPYTASLVTTGHVDGSHTINVTAADGGGRRGYQQITTFFNNSGTVIPAPVVAITHPLNGATVGGTVSVTAGVASTSPLTSVTLYVDGASKGTSSSPYSWSLNTLSLSNGVHVLNVTAIASNGRSGYAQISVTVNNVLGVTIAQPAAGQNYAGTITVSATATGANVISVALTVDGSLVTTLTTGPYSWQLNTANYPDGIMNITVTATDDFGHNASSSISVQVDNAGQEEPIDRMVATIIAGTLAISAAAGAVLVAIGFHRAHRGGGKK